MMIKLRTAVGTCMATAMLGLVTGCADGDETEGVATDGEVERGGVAVLAEGADINAPMSIIANSALDGNLSGDVMNMELLRGAWRDGDIVYLTADQSPMSLAKSYELVGADSTAMRYHMRSDVRWSDGQPVTAHDVVFTYRLVGEPELGSPLADYVTNIDSVTAQNDSTVTFFFNRRYAEMIFHSGTIPPIPRHIYENVAPAQFRNHPSLLNPAGQLVVNGPFMIGQWEQGNRVVLVRNPHFRPEAHLDQIVIRIIPEALTRLVELQTGNVDFVQNIAFDQLPNVRAQPNLRLERQEGRFYDYIAYNPTAHPAFADPEIRRAFAMGINVPQLIQALQMDEFAVPAGGPYSPIFRTLYDESLTTPVPYDPEGARRILEAKGWRDANGDGVREKDGRALRFTLATNTGNTRRGDATQVIQQQWRQIGVDAQIRTLEFNTLQENLNERNFEAVLSGWSVQLNPDLSTLFGEESLYNYTSFRDPRLTALFDRALSEPTKEAAIPHWKQSAQILAQGQPYNWLYFFDGVAAVNNRLRGTEVNTYGPYINTWEWWIPSSQRGGATSAAPADSQ